MNTTTDNPTLPRKKRAQKTPEQKLASLEAKQARLANQVKAEKAKIAGAKRKLDTRKKIVAGAIALEHMEHNPDFKNVMEGLLKKHVTEKDKALFGL